MQRTKLIYPFVILMLITNCSKGEEKAEKTPQGATQPEPSVRKEITGKTFYVSPTGSGNHNGSSPENTLSIDKATSYADSHTSEVITFLLSEGSYGGFSSGTSREDGAWVTYRGNGATKPIFSTVHLSGANYIVFDNIRVNSSFQTTFGNYERWSSVHIYPASNIKIINSHIESHHKKVYDSLLSGGGYPITWGIYIQSAENISIINSKVLGSQFGVSIRGKDILLKDSEIAYQSNDAIRVVSADGVVIDNNYIHDNIHENNPYYSEDVLLLIKNGTITLGHRDGIQFFSSGPKCANPQPKNIVIKNNRFFNMVGQMIFVQSNWTHCIGYIENVTIANNILGRKIEENNAVPIQLQNVKNFVLEHNTVYGSVIIRGASEGSLKDNIIGFLRCRDDIIIKYEDYNLVGEFRSYSKSFPSLGRHSIKRPARFVDPYSNNYRPTKGSFACSMSSTGSYVGALPCTEP